MKIATFNINNVNRRLPNLLNWLKTSRPDVVCLQELKSTDAWRGSYQWRIGHDSLLRARQFLTEATRARPGRK
jgi:exonuclease III